MRIVTAQWYECKVAFDKVMEDGMSRKVTEKYVVDAMSHSEAEVRIVEELKAYVSGTMEVKGIVPAAYKEVFFMNTAERALANQTEELMHAVKKGDKEEGRKVYDRKLEEYNTVDSRWYKAKVAFIVLDVKTNKEKRSPMTYLVEASSVHSACDNIDNALKGSMLDYEIMSVSEHSVTDLFEYETK